MSSLTGEGLDETPPSALPGNAGVIVEPRPTRAVGAPAVAMPLGSPSEGPAAPTMLSRMRHSMLTLGGLGMIGALLPFRGVWAIGVLLAALTLTVPGVIALRALRIPRAAVLAYPVYIPAAALLVLTTSGLLADLLGPLLGIPHPLRTDAAAIAVLLLGLVLWVVAIGAPSGSLIRWKSLLGSPSLMLPLTLPLLSGAGALLLTNGHGALLARVTVALAAACLLGCLICAHRLTTAHVAILLFSCALAAEWAFSLRSQEIVGFDITTEIHIAQQTHAAGLWHTIHHNDAYGAMLSVTVLPSTLAALIGCSPLIVFKVLYPILTAAIPASVFLVAAPLMRRGFAAGAGALLIAQNYFFELLPQLARQEVALFFFAALVAALFDRHLGTTPRLRLIAVLAAGMVVSHYGSTYLAIPALVVAIGLQLPLSRFRRLPAVSPGLLCAAVVLTAGAAFWYGVVTQSSRNLASFSAALEQQGLDPFPTGNGNILTSYFSGNAVTSVSAPAFARLAARDYQDRRAYIHPLAASEQPRFALRDATVPVPTGPLPTLAGPLQWVSTIAGQVMLLFAGLGALLLAFARDAGPTARRIGCLAIGGVAVLVLIRFSGTVAAAYNQTRALLQLLIVLAIPAAWLADRLVHRLHARTLTSAVFASTLVLLFSNQSGATALLTGGGTLLNLSQSGEDFERSYMTPAELAGASWATTESQDRLLYADKYGQLRLWAATGATALIEVTPRTLDQHAWLYGTRTNVVLGRARGAVGSYAAVYQWPNAFLNSYFDTVFSDGDSKVYHR